MVGMAADSRTFWLLILSVEFIIVASQSTAPAPAALAMGPSGSTESQSPYQLMNVIEALRDAGQFIIVASQSTAPAPAALAMGPSGSTESQSPYQLMNVIEALRDAGQFGAVAGLLDGLQQVRTMSPMTTWLLPSDEAFTRTNYPRNVTKFIEYHVVQEFLPYSSLVTLPVGTRLPTFLGSESVVVTSNTATNYSLDKGMVIVRDLYIDGIVAVHGINAILDDALFNEAVNVSPPGNSPAGVPSTPPATETAPVSSEAPSTVPRSTSASPQGSSLPPTLESTSAAPKGPSSASAGPSSSTASSTRPSAPAAIPNAASVLSKGMVLSSVMALVLVNWTM
ncbi:hypothetical protein R1flu_014558 [Riccia fluitans]|uniref:FAS1 domain-containing protein n=1 Tax=Riccia fluitans TaxID=41844 RepID=A0ABD1YK84_9MARC